MDLFCEATSRKTGFTCFTCVSHLSVRVSKQNKRKRTREKERRCNPSHLEEKEKIRKRKRRKKEDGMRVHVGYSRVRGCVWDRGSYTNLLDIDSTI